MIADAAVWGKDFIKKSPIYLRGSAARWFRSNYFKKPEAKWDSIKKRFFEHFSPPDFLNQRMNQQKQRINEVVVSYINRMEVLGSQMKPPLSTGRTIEKIHQGLYHRKSQLLKMFDFKTVPELLNRAKRIELSLKLPLQQRTAIPLQDYLTSRRLSKLESLMISDRQPKLCKRTW